MVTLVPLAALRPPRSNWLMMSYVVLRQTPFALAFNRLLAWR